jgi:hypothetical protein
MDQDRTNWGAREYTDALNRAATPTDLFDLVQEVNEKWAAADDVPAGAPVDNFKRELFEGSGQTQPGEITPAEAMTVALFGVEAEGTPPRPASRRSAAAPSKHQHNGMHPVFSRTPGE